MKHLGQKHGKCPCRYCVGTNNSKPKRKAVKHGARQELKKEIKDVQICYVCVKNPTFNHLAMCKECLEKEDYSDLRIGFGMGLDD